MQIKEYLINPPVLVSPIEGKPFLLYILATNVSLGALLVQHDEENREREVYYIGHTLVGYELNYSSIEKTCLAVVFATQKLWHYMLTHLVKLIAKIDPLKYLLNKPTLTRRLAKWVMTLSEFDIEYINWKAIKGKVIANQLVGVPLQYDKTLQIEFPNVDILTISKKI